MVNKTLVDHNGIIQYKWIISTSKELDDYIFDIGKSLITSRVMNWLKNPNSDKQIDQLYHLKKVGAISLAGIMINDIWKSAEECILDNNVLVFNEAGGYCFWDDKTMKQLKWDYIHESKDVVILENDIILDPEVKEYLIQNNINDYLSLTNLSKYGKDEIFHYTSKANTIVFKTQYIEQEKIDNLIMLSNVLLSKTIIVINSPRFPLEKISKHHKVISIF